MPRPRAQNTRKYWKTVYAIVEGDKTEVEYVKFLKSALPGKHGVEIVHESPGSARQTLFNRAKQIVKDTDEDTEVWIICDVDDAGDELVTLTRNSFEGHERLNWAISNPEFALWLVMHFQDCTKWEDRTVYARLARELGVAIGKRGKDIDKAKLAGTACNAERHAAAARKRQRSAGNLLPDNNPQSDVDQFVRRVIDLYNEHVPAGHIEVEFSSLY